MRVQTPLFHRFSVEEYYRLAEVGILAPDARVELLDGTIYDMLPIGPFHAGVETRLQMLFAEAAKGRWIVRVQNPVHSERWLGTRPRRRFGQTASRLLQAAASAAARCAPARRSRPTIIGNSTVEQNSSLTREAGIEEYWIVNLKAKSVEMHRGPLPIGEYSHESRARAGDIIAPTAFPEVKVSVSDLF